MSLCMSNPDVSCLQHSSAIDRLSRSSWLTYDGVSCCATCLKRTDGYCQAQSPIVTCDRTLYLRSPATCLDVAGTHCGRSHQSIGTAYHPFMIPRATRDVAIICDCRCDWRAAAFRRQSQVHICSSMIPTMHGYGCAGICQLDFSLTPLFALGARICSSLWTTRAGSTH
ncbi:uncharacterized protein LAESUDRAFT_9276 [Laetiporus sulphureus 93-53]|uniref:Uncharacterized protein n=1 Tax=Laetiporus sulphureus 93-53 TaxID=1314785 RepID=A0A165I5M9_9APHY|nr:uncharacterized protein LAESUDRAFT_9276 [Laetiporus sulphureus 93-53]KZT12622.1 hypothetical protein LAESUDRAFT_9276 [Laetiporus sulphureus 93-53]